MKDKELIEHASREQLQDMLRASSDYIATLEAVVRLSDEIMDELEPLARTAPALAERLATYRLAVIKMMPRVERDHARQQGTRKPRKPRRPRLNAWLDRALKSDPGAEGDDLWARIPEYSSEDDLWREDDSVFEDGVKPGLSRGGFNSAVRRARERAAIR